MNDTDYMRLAISLAKQGEGWTNPNPMVGAVVVKDGRIIAQGYHERCGAYHAERNALTRLRESAAGATMYVTLEPCCHQGRTPPCTEIILEHGIRRVFVGSRDPNPLVAGKGAAILREGGVEVVEDFLREECDAINPVFFHYITKGIPYVALKYAMTLDGKIATKTGASRWITGEIARAHTHRLRNRYAAILVGIGTVLADDPLLNCRMEGGKDPIRVVCDSSLRIPLDCQVCRTAGEIPTIVACTKAAPEKRRALEALGITVLELPKEQGHVSIRALMDALGQRSIDSVLVEGGGEIHDAFLSAGVCNHIYAYIAPKLFGGASAKTPVSGRGLALPGETPVLKNPVLTHLGEDVLLEYDVEGGYRKCSQES